MNSVSRLNLSLRVTNQSFAYAQALLHSLTKPAYAFLVSQCALPTGPSDIAISYLM